MSDADTNQKIAEAMGYVYKGRGWYEGNQPPNYLHDANAATGMAEELLPSGWCVRFTHEWDDLGGPYRVMLPGDDPIWPSFFGRKLAPALCEATLAVLAERKDVKP